LSKNSILIDFFASDLVRHAMPDSDTMTNVDKYGQTLLL